MGGHERQDLVARRVRRRPSTAPPCRPASGTGGSSAGLVKLLALAPNRRLHREQVLDALWPDVLVDDAGTAAAQGGPLRAPGPGVPGLRRARRRDGRPVAGRRGRRHRRRGVRAGGRSRRWPTATSTSRSGPWRPTGATCCPTTSTSRGRRRRGSGSPALHRELLRLTGRWEELVALRPRRRGGPRGAHPAVARGGRPPGRAAPVRTPRARPGVRAGPAAGAGRPGPARRAARRRHRCARLRSRRSSSRSAATPELATVDALLDQVPPARAGGRCSSRGSPAAARPPW